MRRDAATRTRRLKVGRDFFTSQETLRSFFSEKVSASDLRAQADKAAGAFLDLPVAERKKLASGLEKTINDKTAAGAPADRKLPARDAARFRPLVRTLPKNADSLDEIARELVLVREALLELVLVLRPGSEPGLDVTLERLLQVLVHGEAPPAQGRQIRRDDRADR